MADTKLSALTTMTTPSTDDLMYIVDDPSGTPLSRAITAGNLKTYMSASPTLVTPVLGVATATTVNKVTITQPATGATLTIVEGGSLITAGAFAITLTATGTTNVTLPTTGTLATLAGSEAFTNKTLTAPKIASGGFIADANGNELIIFTTTASAVNEITIKNGATTVPCSIIASGETNIGILLAGKGTGKIRVGDGADNTKLLTWELVGATTGKTMTFTLSHTNDRALTFPDATDTLVGKATTDTMTNKRITKRVGTVTSSATPTINTDNVDMFTITALAAAITSFTTNLSGTPTTGQALIIRIKDDGTARAITWGASFVTRGAALPTTTVLSKTHYVGFLWNEVASVWDCVSATVEA